MLCSELTGSKLRSLDSWLTMVTITLGLAMTAFPGTPACCLRHDSVSAGLARRRAKVPAALLDLVSLALYLKLQQENRPSLTFCGEYPSSGASSLSVNTQMSKNTDKMNSFVPCLQRTWGSQTSVQSPSGRQDCDQLLRLLFASLPQLSAL